MTDAEEGWTLADAFAAELTAELGYTVTADDVRAAAERARTPLAGTRIDCPRCGLSDPVDMGWLSNPMDVGRVVPSVFRADQPARDGRVEVRCPKCEHRFEVTM